ncbi:MAG: TIGR03936 family radical SAM-associated protein, partial [Lachnospiraceae bacterium]|nr:TIGR03936 family radical SAM-associated protein [Lachnospiraceae bacterium]
SPLGVGVCSNGEYLDVTLNSATTSEDMIRRMNEQTVEGIDILAFQELPENAEKAMSAVAAASYTVDFRPEAGLSIPDLEQTVQDFYAQDSIIIRKQGKKTVTEVDLKEHIHELTVKDGKVYMLVDTGSVTHIKPMLIMEQLCKAAGIEDVTDYQFLITREDTYLKQEDHLYPMNAFCKDIG